MTKVLNKYMNIYCIIEAHVGTVSYKQNTTFVFYNIIKFGVSSKHTLDNNKKNSDE